MGDVKVRYYVTHQRAGRPKWGYWSPCLRRGGQPTLMAKLGFGLVDCGEHGPRAWAIAETWNARWDAALTAHRAGLAPADPARIERVYPQHSLGEAWVRFRATQTWLTKKPRTREDWERGWKHIEPVFGDVDPATVGLEDVDGWYAALLPAIGVRESHRAMKIWRALWRVAGSMKYCDRDGDPSLGIRRKTPTARNATWSEGEAVRLVKGAWRVGYRGAACIMAVGWDTMLSPVDVRGLTAAQRAKDGQGPLYFVERAKTGRAAIGTVGRRTERLVATYLAKQYAGLELHAEAPLFRNRSGVPYTKDTLGDDFRAVRNLVFPGDTRQLMDFRRSGAVEAVAGEVDPAALAGKMANTIDTNKDLQATYLPGNATLVRLADAARDRGRRRLRAGDGDGK